MSKAQTSLTQTLQTRTFACVAVDEVVAVASDFESASTPLLDVDEGALIRVTVNLDAAGKGDWPSGFYWSVRSNGHVSNEIGVTSVVYAAPEAWYGYSTTAFYKAGSKGKVSFNIISIANDLTGNGAIKAMVITAENLGVDIQPTE